MEEVFAMECDHVAAELPEIAGQGHEAVAAEARMRLATRAAKRDQSDAAGERGDDASYSGVRL